MGGRRLRGAPSGVRPTSDRVREALFARLPALEGARVLDLYAGTGALGIEAVSRGASHVVFVERSARAVAALRANVSNLGLATAHRILRGDAVAIVRRLGAVGEQFDLVLVDPPYDSRELARALGAVADAGVLAQGALVVAERPRRHTLPTTPGLAAVDERRYGDTMITRLAAFAAEPPARGDSTT